MVSCNSRPAFLHNDHGTANATPVTSYMYGPMVMVNIDANEFTEAPCASKLPEIGYKTGGVSGEADNGSINVDYEGMLAVYFCAGAQTYI